MKQKGERAESNFADDSAKPSAVLLAESLEETFAERLKYEHDIISHRLTWLMALNGFLIAAAAILTVNHRDIHQFLIPLLISLSLVGTFSNSSVLYSSWWATKAIEEAGYVIADWWKTLDPTGEEHDKRRLRMRLYGRDPQSFHGYRRPTPSKWLHPWLLLPSVFIATFILMPQLAWEIAIIFGPEWSPTFTSSNADWYWTLVPLALPFLVFAGFALWDWKRHLEKDIWAMCYGSAPTYIRPTGARVTKEQAKAHHAAQREEVRQWIQKHHDKEHFPEILLRKPKPWGRIPAATYAHYLDSQQ